MQIEMIRRRYGYFPGTFKIGEVKHTVRSVYRMFATQRHALFERHYFNVHCDDGDYQLYQDLRDNTWHVVTGRRRCERSENDAM